MTAITRSDDVRRQNRHLVISVLRGGGVLSRTDIAARTGLSPSTVSAITSDLIGEAILRENRDVDLTSTRRGRPQVALGLNPEAAGIIAVVLSLNSLSAALIGYAGDVALSEQARLETLTLARDDLVEATRAMVGRLLAHAQASGLAVPRIAFAVQGITDAGGRSLMWSPITPHVDIPFAQILEDAFGIAVSVENDCNMIALALRAKNPARYGANFIAILLSHGIGMGLMLKGELFMGTRSSGAEFGHMNHMPDGALCRCGRRGCVEAYAGNYAIARYAHGGCEDELPPTDVSDQEMLALAAAARAGEGPEREAFRRAGEAIGFGLGSLFSLIDPAPVTLIGQGALAFDLIEGPMRAAIAKTAGGQHHAIPTFETETNEMPLIRAGCALKALTQVDREIFAGGALPSREVIGTRRKAAGPALA